MRHYMYDGAVRAKSSVKNRQRASARVRTSLPCDNMSVGTLMCLLVTGVIFLVTYVYIAVYRIPQERSIVKLITRYYSGPENPDDPNDSDVVARRDRIVRLRQRLGVDIDSLPVVRFESSETDKATENCVRDKEDTTLRTRRHECLSVGHYLGANDDYVDCLSYCGVADGVDYRYYEKSGLILNGRKGRAGAYCVPNDAAACNTKTSLVLYTKQGWQCMPQTRAFAGEGGNLIVVCDGSLLDRATGRIWREHIDPTLTFESIDEKLPNDGGYRFVCPPNLTDGIGNALVPAPFDRLLLLRNVCTLLIPYAQTDELRPNFETGKCECNKPYGSFDEKMGVCVPYNANDSVFRSQTLESSLRGDLAATVDPCLENWTTVSDLEIIAGETKDWRNLRLYPCGVQKEYSGNSMPACVKTYAMTFDRAVPSPYMMLDASESIKKLSVNSTE